jgi:hypothetical protein
MAHKNESRGHKNGCDGLTLGKIIFGFTPRKTLIFHRDGFFFITSSRSWIGIRKKNTPTVTSHIPLFLGGVFSKMLGYLRHTSWLPTHPYLIKYFILVLV